MRRLVQVPVRLGATLTDVFSGAALPGQPATLQVRWRGSDTWVTSVAGLTTDTAGRVAADPAMRKAGWFRFAFPGTAEHAASLSAERYVKVPTRIRMSLEPARHRVSGRLTTLAGTAVGDARLRPREEGRGQLHLAPGDEHRHRIPRLGPRQGHTAPRDLLPLDLPRGDRAQRRRQPTGVVPHLTAVRERDCCTCDRPGGRTDDGGVVLMLDPVCPPGLR